MLYFSKMDWRIIKIILLIILSLFLSGCNTTYRSIYDKNFHVMNDHIRSEDTLYEKNIANMSKEEAVKHGNKYLRNRNINLAQIFFVQALNNDISYIPALIGLGKILLLEGKVTETLELYEKINNENPKNREILCNIAKIHRIIGKTEAAIDYANQALILDPNDPETLMELALTYDAVGNHELAEPLHRSIVNIFPASANAYNNLGCNLILQKRYREALSTLTQALSFSPEEGKIRNNLAMAYALNKNVDSAFNILKKNLGEAEALNNLGYIFMNQGLLEKAESCLKRALEIKPVFYVKASENLERLRKLKMSGKTGLEQ